MILADWTITEWMILGFNIAAISFVVWLLRRRILSKLGEVEERQQTAIDRRKNNQN
tara:strand:- start:206 stop:373 length:168 start_codon:yes stop_codon:yes gene_type:complete